MHQLSLLETGGSLHIPKGRDRTYTRTVLRIYTTQSYTFLNTEENPKKGSKPEFFSQAKTREDSDKELVTKKHK